MEFDINAPIKITEKGIFFCEKTKEFEQQLDELLKDPTNSNLRQKLIWDFMSIFSKLLDATWNKQTSSSEEYESFNSSRAKASDYDCR